jgi:hypothetical protein
MNNLQSMLSKSPEPAAKPQPTPVSSFAHEHEIMISAKLPFKLTEYIRDFQYHEALSTGNLHFSMKDALMSIITNHKAQNPDVIPRPESVIAAEKKRCRK